MSTFKFRLATLLRLRVADRDARRAEVARAQRAEEVLVARSAELRGEQQALRTRGEHLRSPGEADIDALLRGHRYELILRSEQAQVAQQLSQVQAEVERRRQALVEADREVRVLEKLRERQEAEHLDREIRLEQKQIDELATIGFARREERT
jgi:flagellar FliJ protein